MNVLLLLDFMSRWGLYFSFVLARAPVGGPGAARGGPLAGGALEG